MKLLFSALLCVSVCALAPPAVVSEYDIQSYAGFWYQIADYPQFYEFACKECTTAQYTLNSDKTINVQNICRKSPTSKNVTVNAKAMIKNATEPGKLTVVFAGLFPAPYWIIALGPKNADNMYSWALVSNGQRESCYILSRTPTITDAVKNDVLAAMTKQMLDTKKLKFTTQTGCWGGETTAAAVETAAKPLVGKPQSFHASCKMTFNFPSTTCPNVIDGLSVAAKKLHGLDICGKNPINNLCGYTETGQSASTWKGTHTTANGKYTDDLSFNLAASGAGCTVGAYSTSETWYAVLDNGVNYCNLHNLVNATGFSFTETDVSDSTCTQYSSRNCARY